MKLKTFPLIAGYTYDAIIIRTAYDSDPFRADIVTQGGLAVIRPRNNRLKDCPYDQELYKL